MLQVLQMQPLVGGWRLSLRRPNLTNKAGYRNTVAKRDVPPAMLSVTNAQLAAFE